MATISVATTEKVMPRIGPKVFADVPSQKELEEAKASSKSLMLWVFLLAGALAMAVAFIVYLTVLNKPAEPDTTLPTQIAQLKEQLKAANAKADAAAADLTTVREDTAPYRRIKGLERSIQSERTKIKAALGPPAQDKDIRYRLREHSDEWKTFDAGAKWSGTSEAQIADGLDGQLTQLISLEKAVADLGLPALPVPVPPCLDPRKNPPC